MKKTFILLFTFITLNALKVSMLFFCDDYCTTIKVDDKIIYNEGYKSQEEQSDEIYFQFPEFEAEKGQIIQILVSDVVVGQLKLCGLINIDGYIFSTNKTDYWIDVGRNHGQKFLYQEAREGYLFD